MKKTLLYVLFVFFTGLGVFFLFETVVSWKDAIALTEDGLGGLAYDFAAVVNTFLFCSCAAISTFLGYRIRKLK